VGLADLADFENAASGGVALIGGDLAFVGIGDLEAASAVIGGLPVADFVVAADAVSAEAGSAGIVFAAAAAADFMVAVDSTAVGDFTVAGTGKLPR